MQSKVKFGGRFISWFPAWLVHKGPQFVNVSYGLALHPTVTGCAPYTLIGILCMLCAQSFVTCSPVTG